MHNNDDDAFAKNTTLLQFNFVHNMNEKRNNFFFTELEQWF